MKQNRDEYIDFKNGQFVSNKYLEQKLEEIFEISLGLNTRIQIHDFNVGEYSTDLNIQVINIEALNN